jgi:hypothetical protein
VKDLESKLMAYLEEVHAEILYPVPNSKVKKKNKNSED